MSKVLEEVREGGDRAEWSNSPFLWGRDTRPHDRVGKGDGGRWGWMDQCAAEVAVREAHSQIGVLISEQGS